MLKKFRRQLTNRKGFTLVELLVVVAIIGILAAIAIPKFTEANKIARGSKIVADLRTMDSASQLYYASAGATAGAIATLKDSNLIATVPDNLAGSVSWKTTKLSADNGGSYGWSGDRPTFAGSTVENF